MRQRQDELYKRNQKASKVVSRTDDGFVEWDTPDGRFWTVPAQEVSFLLAEQETDIYGTGEGAVRKGDIVLDCGANIGVFTRKALSAGAKLVVSIEPIPALVQCLRRTFASEIQAGRVIVLPKGVWNKEDVLPMNVAIGSLDESSFVKNGPGTQKTVYLPLTTIDQLVSDLQLPRVDFIKMDIEGAERQALMGGEKTIRAYKPRMTISTEHLADDDTVLPAVIQRMSPYRHACGPCSFKTHFYFGPEAINFF